jgi:hypothetical protein
MTAAELALVRRHTSSGESALMALDDAQDAARLLRSHHEHFDGSGYPDRLKGEAIPLGARILAVANDYDALQAGTLLARSFSEVEARDFILAGSGKRYDPQVADALRAALQGLILNAPKERVIGSVALEPGMVLSRDLAGQSGVLLLAADHALTIRHIARIRAFEHDEDLRLEIHVKLGTE